MKCLKLSMGWVCSSVVRKHEKDANSWCENPLETGHLEVRKGDEMMIIHLKETECENEL
jgi:hypothetical protein